MSSPGSSAGPGPNPKQASVGSDAREWVRKHKHRPEASVLCTQDGPFLQTPAEERRPPPLCGPHAGPLQRGPDAEREGRAPLRRSGQKPQKQTEAGGPGRTPREIGSQRAPWRGWGWGAVSLRKTRKATESSSRKTREMPSAQNTCPGLPKLPSLWAHGPSAGLRAGAARGDPTPTCDAASWWGAGRDEGPSTKAKDAHPIKPGPQPLRRTGRHGEAQAPGPPSPQASCSRTAGSATLGSGGCCRHPCGPELAFGKILPAGVFALSPPP